jgi:hypothetical protein
MNLDSQALITGYLDETLTPSEHDLLKKWLNESRANAQQFAEAVLLHDRLRGEHQALMAVADSVGTVARELATPPSPRFLTFSAAASVLLVAAAVLLVIWIGVGGTPVSAAAELKRIIAANAQLIDRTYQITMEEPALMDRNAKRNPASDSRPPKPPIDGATLYVRNGNQFVLIRQTAEGFPFITGSNGRSSWAVRSEGPVRVSADLTRFNRDLPGHEHSMPLISITDGLDRLRAAYDIDVLPVEDGDAAEVKGNGEQSRLMVAVKKRGFRGPRRVEITYFVNSGLIRQLRFVEMPYGPERLTLRLTLVEDRPLGETFFDHESHHDSNRTIEFEE